MKKRKPMSRSRKAAWTRFIIAAFFAVVFVVFALYASSFARYDPLQTDYAHMLEGPSAAYWFGTDQLGRDIYSRILYGGKTSLLIAFVVTGIVAAAGIFIGTAAGFIGGAFDSVLMRFCDMLMAFPGSIFTIALVSFIGTGIPNLILAMSLTSWTGFARISRSLVLSIKNNVFVEQARLGGASDWKILMVYIIPNVLPSLLVNIFQSIGGKLLTISGLSLLGLGFSFGDGMQVAAGPRLPAAHAGMGLHALRGKEFHVPGPLDADVPRLGDPGERDHFQPPQRQHPGADEPQGEQLVTAKPGKGRWI